MNRYIALIMSLFLTLGFHAWGQESGHKITLRLMGDSTMADKDLSKGNPERGWGQRLPSHLDTMVTVCNYAQNGRSTKSFIDRGLWDQVKRVPWRQARNRYFSHLFRAGGSMMREN